jgi:FkbM family methyltransferase
MQRVAVVAWASGRRPFSLEVTKGATMRNTLALYRGVRSIGFHSVYRTIREFGLRNGLVVSRARATSAAKSSPQGKLTRVFTRNSGLPIYLREGTSDWSVLDQIFVRSEYDYQSPGHDNALNRFYADTVSRSEIPLILDCGANIGLSSIWFARKYPLATVIAIEPESENFRMLTMNTTEYANILAVHGGVSDRDGKMSLFNSGNEPWAWQGQEADDGDVKTYTVPNLIIMIPNSRLLIVKIDIEGGEANLFRSNLEWVAESPLIVFEAHDWHFNWRGTFHAVASALTKEPRDYLHNGENTFSFSHALLSAEVARES